MPPYPELSKEWHAAKPGPDKCIKGLCLQYGPPQSHKNVMCNECDFYATCPKGLEIHKTRAHRNTIPIGNGEARCIPKAFKAIPVKCKLHGINHCEDCGYTCPFCPNVAGRKWSHKHRLNAIKHYRDVHCIKQKFPDLGPDDVTF